ncbi:UNVERIFIED_CONTAM: hypothetical protein HDU68_008864 [Siphonaria sp. JEL0065]|nr:hypothetical protein HDU68_008864 [Siphonaria sp. JEL0065]
MHLRGHSGYKPHKCDFCDYSTAIGANLITHKRSHSGSKPYKCPECNRGFTTSTDVKRHLRIHSGLKPFNTVAGLKRHEKTLSHAEKQRELNEQMEGHYGSGGSSSGNANDHGGEVAETGKTEKLKTRTPTLDNEEECSALEVGEGGDVLDETENPKRKMGRKSPKRSKAADVIGSESGKVGVAKKSLQSSEAQQDGKLRRSLRSVK